jgi:hypothetical protein
MTASPAEKQDPAIETMARAIHDADPKTAAEGRWDDVWVHEGWRERAREAARAARAVLADSGFVIVPREPTAEMIAAACKSMSPGRRPTPDRVSVREKHSIRWRAMVEAAEH